MQKHRSAGLPPAAVISEIIRDDGEMARLPDLMAFVTCHGLNIGSISDLIAHRQRQSVQSICGEACGDVAPVRVFSIRIEALETLKVAVNAPGLFTVENQLFKKKSNVYEYFANGQKRFSTRDKSAEAGHAHPGNNQSLGSFRLQTH